MNHRKTPDPIPGATVTPVTRPLAVFVTIILVPVAFLSGTCSIVFTTSLSWASPDIILLWLLGLFVAILALRQTGRLWQYVYRQEAAAAIAPESDPEPPAAPPPS